MEEQLEQLCIRSKQTKSSKPTTTLETLVSYPPPESPKPKESKDKNNKRVLRSAGKTDYP